MARLSVRKLIGWAALSVSGLAAVNTYLAVTAPPLLPPVKEETQRHLWRGFRLAYWVGGPEDAPPVLLVHDHHIAASAYEMRRAFLYLTEHFRVFLLDLLGYGLSARPPLWYTAETFQHLIADFARDVVGRPVHVVAAGLSAAHAILAASESPELFRSLTLICPAGVGAMDTPPSDAQRLLHTLLRCPILGEAAFNALSARPVLAYFLTDRLYASPSLVTEELIDMYYATAHQPGARFAPAAFLGGELNCNARQAFAALTQPIQLIWGRAAVALPVTLAQSFLELNDRARLDVLENAGGVPQEEQPEPFAARVTEFVRDAA